mgnify:CR=1 FL=1
MTARKSVKKTTVKGKKKTPAGGGEAQVRNFLARLHRGGTYGYLWTNSGKQKFSYWYKVVDGPSDLKQGEPEVYFGVHPTDAIPETNAQGQRVSQKAARSRVDFINAINCLFADFDVGDGDMHAEFERIRGLQAPPSVVVNSGHGYHAYWILSKTGTLKDDKARALASQRQAAWVAMVGGDPNAKDLARVLRLPGTINAKQDPLPVRIVHDSNGAYALKDLEGYLPTKWRDMVPPDAPGSALVGQVDPLRVAQAFNGLQDLAGWRRDDYSAWLQVGMSLRELGALGLAMWDAWSKGSNKYRPGDCTRKWETLAGRDGGITLASLGRWADEDVTPDKPRTVVPFAPRRHDGTNVRTALRAMGYQFRMEESSLMVEVNGLRINDPLRDTIHWELYNRGYRNSGLVDMTISVEALNNPFHPVKEYLDTLVWDGEDHITKLVGHFTDMTEVPSEDPEGEPAMGGVFPRFLRSWLVGAVQRVYGARATSAPQNRMLVLAGPQGIGKSYFARWLASAIPQLFIENPINTADKDERIRLTEVWIWEVGELGASIRRADRESWKFFISTETVTVRRPYGRFDIKKPALTSFIGTLNNTGGGYLDDPSGYRRYLPVTIDHVDWAYARDPEDGGVDPNQVWAQAKALYDAGERGDLGAEDGLLMEKIAETVEIPDPLEETLRKYIEVDAAQDGWFLPTLEVVEEMRIRKLGSGVQDTEFARRIAERMGRLGARSRRVVRDKNKVSGFQCVRWRDGLKPGDLPTGADGRPMVVGDDDG